MTEAQIIYDMTPIIQRIVMVIATLCTFLSALAYDFELDGIYYNITSVRTVEVTYSYESGGSYSGDVKIPQMLIGDNKTYTVTSIGGGTFYKCNELTSVSMPNSVTSIGDWVFEDCISLEAIYVEPDNTAFCSLDGILYNKEMTELIRCPQKMASASMPNSVTSIGDKAFGGCSSLTSVTIPNSVISIGVFAFYDCSSLASVTMPNSVTSIGDYAFYNCSSLASMTIPNSVTSIGEGAFYVCSRLKAIYNQIIEPFSCAPYFSNDNLENTILYVPTGSLSAYEKVDPWRTFRNIREMDYSGVQGVEPDGDAKTEIGRYNLQGLEVDSYYKGLIIIRYSDGSYCKMYAK